MTDTASLAPDNSEARWALLTRARGASTCIPFELLVDHVLAVTRARGADFAVQEAALEALQDRDDRRRRERLAIAGRPPGPFGVYSTRRGRDGPRPYRTLLQALRPLDGSCDCPDFLRSSLGLCKHLLAVLDGLASDAASWRAGLAGLRRLRPRLRWDPIRSLAGVGDWLEQVEWRAREAPPAARHATWHPGAGAARLVPRGPLDPQKRLVLVESLRAATALERDGDPALVALLEAERARLLPLAREPLAREVVARRLRALARPLYPYQVEGVQALLTRGRLLLADDMGLGKTAQAIAACHVLLATRRVERALLVVPAPLKVQWLREWSLFSREPVAVVEGDPAARRALLRRTGRGALIVNYEQVLRDRDELVDWGPQLVVLDEAQRIKNGCSKTARSLAALRPPWRLALTGTPLENRLDELASIVEWVDERALAPRWRLTPFHLARSADGTQPGRARRLDVLRERLAPTLVRRLRRDVLPQLPGRTDARLPVLLGPEQRERHDALRWRLALLAQEIKRRRRITPEQHRQLMGLITLQRIIANGLAQHRFEEVWPDLEGRAPTPELLAGLEMPKLEALRELLEQVVVVQGRRAVVFSQWRRMITLAAWATSDLLAGAGGRAVFFTGEEDGRLRTRNLVDFHDDPSARVLFATDAGAVGLNLQRAATCCVHLEVPWNPALFEQRVGRIHRLGQTEPIDVHTLLSVESIEERIADAAADKRALAAGLLDEAATEVGLGAGSCLRALQVASLDEEHEPLARGEAG